MISEFVSVYIKIFSLLHLCVEAIYKSSSSQASFLPERVLWLYDLLVTKSSDAQITDFFMNRLSFDPTLYYYTYMNIFIPWKIYEEMTVS